MHDVDRRRQLLLKVVEQIDDTLGVGHDVRGVVIVLLREREAIRAHAKSAPDRRFGLSPSKKHVVSSRLLAVFTAFRARSKRRRAPALRLWQQPVRRVACRVDDDRREQRLQNLPRRRTRRYAGAPQIVAVDGERAEVDRIAKRARPPCAGTASEPPAGPERLASRARRCPTTAAARRMNESDLQVGRSPPPSAHVPRRSADCRDTSAVDDRLP